MQLINRDVPYAKNARTLALNGSIIFSVERDTKLTRINSLQETSAEDLPQKNLCSQTRWNDVGSQKD